MQFLTLNQHMITTFYPTRSISFTKKFIWGQTWLGGGRGPPLELPLIYTVSVYIVIPCARTMNHCKTSWHEWENVEHKTPRSNCDDVRRTVQVWWDSHHWHTTVTDNWHTSASSDYTWSPVKDRIHRCTQYPCLARNLGRRGTAPRRGVLTARRTPVRCPSHSTGWWSAASNNNVLSVSVTKQAYFMQTAEELNSPTKLHVSYQLYSAV